MRPVAVVVAILVALTLAGPVTSPAGAGDDRLLTPNHWAPPPARTPPILKGGDPGIDGHRHRRGHHRHGKPDHGHDGHHGHDRHHHRHWSHQRSSLIFLAPSRCWQPGYWTHQWVPQAYTYNTWVAGHWSPDGRWVEGHYAPYVHWAGYYQPVWVEGYWTAC